MRNSQEQITCSFSRRPSSCIVQVYDDDGVLLNSGLATLGEQFTVSGVCGISQSDRYKLKLYPSISGVKVDHSYLLRNSSGQSERTVLRSKPPTPSLCDVLQALSFDYDDGDNLEDTTCYRTLSTSETDELGVDYRANFYASLEDGTVEVKDVIFDVVNSKFTQPITSENLHKYDPIISSHFPTGYSSWDDLLEVAWDAVYTDILSTGIRPELIMDEKKLALLHLYKFRVLLAEVGIATSDMKVWVAAPRYDSKYNELFRTINKKLGWEDRDEDNVPNTDEKDPTWNRFYI